LENEVELRRTELKQKEDSLEKELAEIQNRAKERSRTLGFSLHAPSEDGNKVRAGYREYKIDRLAHLIKMRNILKRMEQEEDDPLRRTAEDRVLHMGGFVIGKVIIAHGSGGLGR